MGHKQIRICDRCKAEFPGGDVVGFKELRGVELKAFLYGPIWDSTKGKDLVWFKGELCDDCTKHLITAVEAFKKAWDGWPPDALAAIKTAKRKQAATRKNRRNKRRARR